MFSHSDIVCLSHLNWDSVYQRPHHLMSRFARDCRVFFVNEVQTTPRQPHLEISEREDRMRVVTPLLPDSMKDTNERYVAIRRLLDDLFRDFAIRNYVLWYYTPMALPCTRHFTTARAVVYDCMDELSAFKKAPPSIRALEAELFTRADVVFTGGQSLYEAKRHLHPNVHPLPSSVDVAHFGQARTAMADPVDQAALPHPRLGFFGVIDERMDLDLVDGVAAARPDWQLVLLGPCAKIDRAALPGRPNIHYLGGKPYAELPSYLAGWEVAWLPFARNESTRFISPTKTPEYLAAGKPVISTSIRDVVRPYGERGLVTIADDVSSTVAALEQALHQDTRTRRNAADAFLSTMSWDGTWTRMVDLMEAAALRRTRAVTTRAALRDVRGRPQPLVAGASLGTAVAGGE
jgi:glycosyltransferase involved in cell wall biosynthesis